MALKGETLIELTDVHTGIFEVYRDENIITNALQNIMDVNWHGITGDKSKFLPVYKNLLGGLYLFEDTIVENPKIVVPPHDNMIVGAAADIVNGSAYTNYGSINVNESSELEDGYKWVWDFNSNQSNGTISCACLTSALNIKAEIGIPGVLKEKETGWWLDNVSTEDSKPSIINLLDFNLENGEFISLSRVDPTLRTFIFKRCKARIENIGLKSIPKTVTLIETVPIPLPQTGSDHYNFWNLSNGCDGFIYAVNAVPGSATSVILHIVKISKKDFSYDNSTITVNVRTTLKGNGFENRIQLQDGAYVVLKGYLYAHAVNITDKCTFYKINLANPTDIVLLESEASSSGLDGVYGVKRPSRIDGSFGYELDGANFYITSDDKVKQRKSARPELTYVSAVHDKNIVVRYVDSYDQHLIYLFYNFEFLATINNLSTPVVKTPDKTMKITYILREVTG